jgi:hypothetical protein
MYGPGHASFDLHEPDGLNHCESDAPLIRGIKHDYGYRHGHNNFLYHYWSWREYDNHCRIVQRKQ